MGKEVLLAPERGLIYDFNSVDGEDYMLDRRLSGKKVFSFNCGMDFSKRGVVTLDGSEITEYLYTKSMAFGDKCILAIPLVGRITECEKEYILHIEGFQSEEGKAMQPTDFVMRGPGKQEIPEQFSFSEETALEAARESMVLLRNENHVLPIQNKKEGKTILNVFGRAIYNFRSCAAGAGKIHPRFYINFFDAVERSHDYELNTELLEFYRCDRDLIPNNDILLRAKKENDIGIVFLSRGTGENFDNSTEKGEYYLTDEEEALIQAVADNFTSSVVVLNSGYPIDVSFIKRYGVDAVLAIGYAGMFSGQALFDILTGAVSPSAKLSQTWPLDYSDIPAGKNFYDCAGRERLNTDCGLYMDTYYEEDIYVGYRYFETFHREVAYKYGYGLSYTDFSVQVQCVDFSVAQGLHIEVNVSNVGKRAGKEVIQIYVGAPDGVLEKPEKQLVEFEKTELLSPEESQKLTFAIPLRHMTSYSEEKAAYLLEPGIYKVFVGTDVDSACVSEFTLEEEIIVKKVQNLMRPNLEFGRMSKYIDNGFMGQHNEINPGANDFTRRTKRKKYPVRHLGEAPDALITYDMIKENPDLVEAFVSQLSLEELARIVICGSHGWSMEAFGEAGRIVGLEKYGQSPMAVADGNSGLNLKIPNIGMPSGLGYSCSFNKKLVENIGRAIALEARDKGIHIVLGPSMNLLRNPLNGRNPEYYSEDPYQSGVIGAYFAKGLEAAGVGSCMKHMIANNCEASRKRNQSIISERAIRELYFRSFEIMMEIQMPASVMTAYNACNGQPTATDAELICGMLREECGFDGFVMSDWNSYDTADIVEMINAGNCWITPGSLDDTHTSIVVEGVKNGRISVDRLRENVYWIVKTMLRYV